MSSEQTYSTAESRLSAWNDAGRIRKATLLLSVALYAGLLFALLHPDSMPQWERFLGVHPFGLPLIIFVTFVITIFYLPLPFGTASESSFVS